MPDTTDILASRNRPSVVQRGQETPGVSVPDIPLPDRTGPTQVPLSQDDTTAAPSIVPDVANLVLGVPEDTPTNRIAPFIQDNTAKKKAQALRRLSSLAAISNPGLAHNLMQRAAIMDEESVRGSAVGLLSTVNDFNKAGRHQDSLEAIQLFVNREGVDPRLQEIALKLAEKTHRESKKLAFGRRLVQSLVNDGKIDQTERAVAAIDALSSEAVDINDLATAFDMIGGEGLLKGRPGDVFMDPQTGETLFSIPDPVKVRDVSDNLLILRSQGQSIPGRPDLNDISPETAKQAIEFKTQLRRKEQESPPPVLFFDGETVMFGPADGNKQVLDDVNARKMQEGVIESVNVVRNINKILPLISPETAGLTGKLNLAFGEFVQIFTEFGVLLDQRDAIVRDLEKTNSSLKWRHAFERLEEATAVQAMLLNIAYAKARAVEGGRLTNEDFDRNAIAIGKGAVTAARTRAALLAARDDAIDDAQFRAAILRGDPYNVNIGIDFDSLRGQGSRAGQLEEEVKKSKPVDLSRFTPEIVSSMSATDMKALSSRQINALADDPELGPIFLQRLEELESH